MSKSNYQIDPQGLKSLANTPGMSAAMVARAEVGLAKARASAPRNTGDFSRSFKVRPEEIKAGRRGDTRAGAVIESTVDYGAFVGGKKPGHFMSTLVPHIEGKQ